MFYCWDWNFKRLSVVPERWLIILEVFKPTVVASAATLDGDPIAKSRILSGVCSVCWEHREALRTASPWKAGLREVGPRRLGSHPWQNWLFKIHIYSSASFGGQGCRSARDEHGGRLRQTYRFSREDERRRCWQERTCSCVKFGLPNSAEKVKNIFCLLVCGVAHR